MDNPVESWLNSLEKLTLFMSVIATPGATYPFEVRLARQRRGTRPPRPIAAFGFASRQSAIDAANVLEWVLIEMADEDVEVEVCAPDPSIFVDNETPTR